MNVLITGHRGFIGSNLKVWLKQRTDVKILEAEQETSDESLRQMVFEADLVYHLAGINRPDNDQEFRTGNVDFTQQLCNHLLETQRPIPLIFSSSIQAELDNPYGVSKRHAEMEVSSYAQLSGAAVYIYRLTNVFGKWCSPNYNSAVATFCYNIARDLPVHISDPSRQMALVHVDDVVRAFLAHLDVPTEGGVYQTIATPIHEIGLGDLVEMIRLFRRMRTGLEVPDFSDAFTHKLYGTYLSYLPSDDFSYDLTQRCDNRGCLAEFVKSPQFGQIFVSRTTPGITRGNHFHHVKTEKFLVLEGEAIIRFRHIRDGNVLEYRVRGEDFKVLDIPTGYTHSIENIGQGELVTLFWASEIFDPERPDTIFEKVQL